MSKENFSPNPEELEARVDKLQRIRDQRSTLLDSFITPQTGDANDVDFQFDQIRKSELVKPLQQSIENYDNKIADVQAILESYSEENLMQEASEYLQHVEHRRKQIHILERYVNKGNTSAESLLQEIQSEYQNLLDRESTDERLTKGLELLQAKEAPETAMVVPEETVLQVPEVVEEELAVIDSEGIILGGAKSETDDGGEGFSRLEEKPSGLKEFMPQKERTFLVNGNEITTSSPQQIALLELIESESKAFVSRDEILHTLFGDEPDTKQRRKNARAALTRTRKLYNQAGLGLEFDDSGELPGYRVVGRELPKTEEVELPKDEIISLQEDRIEQTQEVSEEPQKVGRRAKVSEKITLQNGIEVEVNMQKLIDLVRLFESKPLGEVISTEEMCMAVYGNTNADSVRKIGAWVTHSRKVYGQAGISINSVNKSTATPLEERGVVLVPSDVEAQDDNQIETTPEPRVKSETEVELPDGGIFDIQDAKFAKIINMIVTSSEPVLSDEIINNYSDHELKYPSTMVSYIRKRVNHFLEPLGYRMSSKRIGRRAVFFVEQHTEDKTPELTENSVTLPNGEVINSANRRDRVTLQTLLEATGGEAVSIPDIAVKVYGNTDKKSIDGVYRAISELRTILANKGLRIEGVMVSGSKSKVYYLASTAESQEEQQTEVKKSVEVRPKNARSRQEILDSEMSQARLEAVKAIFREGTTIQDIIDILGPSQKTKRLLTWSQARRSLSSQAGLLYQKNVKGKGVVFDSEREVWNMIARELNVPTGSEYRELSRHIFRWFDEKRKEPTVETTVPTEEDAEKAPVDPNKISIREAAVLSSLIILNEDRPIKIDDNNFTFTLDDEIKKTCATILAALSEETSTKFDDREFEKIRKQVAGKISEIVKSEQIDALLESQDDAVHDLLIWLFDKEFGAMRGNLFDMLADRSKTTIVTDRKRLVVGINKNTWVGSTKEGYEYEDDKVVFSEREDIETVAEEVTTTGEGIDNVTNEVTDSEETALPNNG